MRYRHIEIFDALLVKITAQSSVVWTVSESIVAVMYDATMLGVIETSIALHCMTKDISPWLYI